MSEEEKRLILPFAVPAKDRTKAFTKDMEMAAVFYLAESEREKGEQLILKKPVEKIAFLTETCYPVWLIPWKGRTLLFDGFGATGHTIYYNVLPDVRTFETDIQASAETPEAYSATLSNNLNYFQNFTGKEENTIEGLITDPEFTKDFTSYLKEATKIKKPVVGKAFLSPSISESLISNSLRELSDLRRSLEKDIQNLRRSMKSLSTATKENVEAIQKETRKVRKMFDEKIATVEPIVMQKLEEIQKMCDREITQLSKKHEGQLRDLHKDRVRLDKQRQQMLTQIERCETEIKSAKLRKDEGGEVQWKRKLKSTKKELPAVKKKIEEMDKKIKKAEASKKIEIAKIRSDYETKTEEAKKELDELEDSRDARIRMKDQQRESLQDMTAEIIDQINEKVKLKKLALDKLQEIGMSKKQESNVLVHIPLYLADYEAKQKRRYIVYPPSIVGSMGLFTKAKGVFGLTKMKSFLQHRSKAIATLLNQLVTLLAEDPVFERETNDAGVQANILGTTESLESIKKGLRELKKEGWLSETEAKTFSEAL